MATCLFFPFPFPAINLAILPCCTEPSGLLSRFVTSPNNVTLTALRADAVLDVGQCASTDTITALVAADEDGSAGASTCGRGAAARAD